jgi:DUF4097 and DUF4098 domain-containing protein YvlB
MHIRTTGGLLASLLAFAAPTLAAEKVFDRTFTVTPGGLLTVNADAADISVESGSTDKVVVHIVASASQSELDALDLSAEQTSSGVTVEALKAKSRGSLWVSWNMDARIKVSVPRNYRVDLKTSGGDMSVIGIAGDANGKTSGGDIDLRDITGQVKMRTSGGDVKAASIKGDLNLVTSGGEIVVKTAQGRVDVETSGGGIRLDSIEGPTRARTSSGDVVINNVRGDVEASTSGGDVKLVHADGKLRATSSGGEVDCELIGANRGIYASTSGGNISLRVAKDITGTLDASANGGKITSELPVTTTVAGDKRLSGPINGGGEQIFAHTSGGNVRLAVAR